jgi:hypothetical protein
MNDKEDHMVILHKKLNWLIKLKLFWFVKTYAAVLLDDVTYTRCIVYSYRWFNKPKYIEFVGMYYGSH